MTGESALLATVVVVASVATPIAVGAVFYAGMRHLGHGSRSAVLRAGGVGGLLAGWLAVTAAVADTGRYADETWLGVGLAVPLVSGLLVLRLPSVKAALALPRAAAALAAIQTLRVVGAVFLASLVMQDLPAGFAVPAGTGDVLVGLSAPLVAYALWCRPKRPAIGIAFNILGLTDLVVAIPLGVLHAPGRLQVLVTEPTTEIMAVLPMALIPTFVVPIAIVLHIASLRLLLAPRRRDRPLLPAVTEADSRHGR